MSATWVIDGAPRDAAEMARRHWPHWRSCKPKRPREMALHFAREALHPEATPAFVRGSVEMITEMLASEERTA